MVPACLCSASVDQSDGSEKMTLQIIAEFVEVHVISEYDSCHVSTHIMC